ncbi:zinc-dependent alcohol dehydrogenase family protein [Nocardioides insulae]|uniref:zinc-dependent alcohol dehydrogenase family protein n=1 Tax=Nocardioides insulae TaxID=394734 RepID=UPI000404E2EE|nr:zinc-dependent alcohol dehydrogenase family protein [Nocardioides insulae]
MRAATAHAAYDVRLSEVPDPVIKKPTDAIVKVVAGCVCGSDLWTYRGENEIVPGRTMGHECIGVVEEVGTGVRRVRPGDFVIVPFVHCDNTCAHCRAGAQSACTNAGFTVTGQGEYARVTQADGSLVTVPETPEPAQLPALLALTDVMATGWHAAVSAGVREGGTAVVIGDGAVGLCGVLAAAVQGAETVIAMSRHRNRQVLATRFGATHLVPERGEEGEQAVLELTGGLGADATLECVGTDQSMHSAFQVARPGSTVGFVGVPHGIQVPIRRLFESNVGLRGGMAPVRRYLPDLLELVLSGRIDPGAVFDRTLPLEEISEAYRLMDQREAVKVMITP